MSAPWLWMVLPGVGGVVLLFWRPPTRRGVRWAGVLALLLAGLALVLPIDTAIALGKGISFRLDSHMVVLGRQFVLSDAARVWLAMLYGGLALWMAGAYVARMPAFAPGLAWVTTALGVGALAVRPSLYAVLLMVLASWASLPLLVQPTAPYTRGAVRWLALQTLAVPLLLYAGWLLSSAGVGALDEPVARRALGLLGLGVALLLSLFPFHSPISLLSGETSPYALVWIVLLSTGVVGTWGMGYLYGPLGLRESSAGLWLRTVGVLMWALGGVLAPFQRHAGRVLGYVVLTEAGAMLVALSLTADWGLPLFFLLWAVRGVTLVILGSALAWMRMHKGGLGFREIQGLGRTFPLMGLAVVFAVFTLAGVPWLPGAQPRMALWGALASVSPWALAGALLGAGGLWGAGLRLVGVLFTGRPALEPESGERVFPERIFFALGLAVLFLGGVFPDLWIKPLMRMVQHLWLGG